MRTFFLSALCSLACFVTVGCSTQSTEPTAVTTDEDAIAAYEASIAGEEEEAQADLEPEE